MNFCASLEVSYYGPLRPPQPCHENYGDKLVSCVDQKRSHGPLLALTPVWKASWKEGADWFTHDSTQRHFFREIQVSPGRWMHRAGADHILCWRSSLSTRGGGRTALFPLWLASNFRSGEEYSEKDQLWGDLGLHPRTWAQEPALHTTLCCPSSADVKAIIPFCIKQEQHCALSPKILCEVVQLRR